MNKFNVEMNDPIIIKKGINALIDFYKTMAIDKLCFSELSAFVTGIDSPFLNIVIDTREVAQGSSDAIVIEKFFSKHHVPWSWFITPIVKNFYLDQLGFSLLEEVPNMYFNLENIIPTVSLNFIDIKELTGNDDLSDWIKPVFEGFGGSDDGEKYRRLNVKLQQKNEKKFRHYVALYKSEVAAAGTLFLSDDCVMIHNLATKNYFRKLGLGTALTIHMMKESKKNGYKHCFLDSSEDGVNLYHKIGFQIYAITLVYNK